MLTKINCIVADFLGDEMKDPKQTKYLRDLRRQMVDCFDIAELKSLAFDLNIDWDVLAGEEKLSKVRSLILYLRRHDDLQSLLRLLNEERPQIEWPQIYASKS